MGLFLGSACGAVARGAHARGAACARTRLPAKFVWLTDVVGAVALVVLRRAVLHA